MKQKTIVCLLTVLLSLLLGSTAMAAEAVNSWGTVTGTLADAAGETVTMLLVPKSADMANIQAGSAALQKETTVNPDGSYRFTFSFSGFSYGNGDAVQNYAVCVKRGDTDVTATVTEAKARIDFTPVPIAVEPKVSAAQIKAQTDEMFRLDGIEYDLLFVGYDANNKLLACVSHPADADATQNTNVWKELKGAPVIKVFLSSDAAAPILTAKQVQDGTIVNYDVTFPTYSKKAITFSIDDGNYARDAAIINMMHKYGIRATFNLIEADNSGKYDIYVHPDFEIANHTTHIRMNLTENYTEADGTVTTPPTYENCIGSINTANQEISNKLGAQTKGLVWPFAAPRERDFYPDLVTWAGENGYEYCRDSHTNGIFDVPKSWMDWKQTVWTHADWVDKVKKLTDMLVDMPQPDKFQILSIAGHGNDMEESVALDLYETIFQKIQNTNIWNATNLEIVLYEKATHKLEITETGIYNPTDVTMYLYINGQKCVAKPKSNAVPA